MFVHSRIVLSKSFLGKFRFEIDDCSLTLGRICWYWIPLFVPSWLVALGLEGRRFL